MKTRGTSPRSERAPGAQVHDRVRELRRERAGDLRPSPRNWRTHPRAQVEVMQGILAEVGYADALLAVETPAGLELVDGHLRAGLDPEQVVPVLVLDLTPAEAAKVMLTLDPLAAMAEADAGRLDALLRDVSTSNEALAGMLTELAESAGVVPGTIAEEDPEDPDETPPERWGVYVECADEAAQRALLESLTAEGYDCRGVTV